MPAPAVPAPAQRPPGLRELRRALRESPRQVPGMLRTSADYASRRVRGRTPLRRSFLDCEGVPSDAPDPDRELPGDPATLLRRSCGTGPLYRRLYACVVDDPRAGPEEVVSRLLVDPNRASPVEVTRFAAESVSRDVGAEFVVAMPGPWTAPVRVVEKGPTAFRFHTLRGHMEAGEIEFRCAWAKGGRLLFEIESWARSADRLYDLLYTTVPVSREMQMHMWVSVCEKVAVMAGGRLDSGVSVSTWRWKGAT